MAEFATNGKGNLGVALGAIGTGLGVIGPHVGSLFGWNGGYSAGGGYVTKEAFELAQKNASLQSELALVKADQESEKKMADVFERLSVRVRALEDKESEKWANQSVINAQLISGQSVLQSQVGQLMNLTKLVIPNGSCCPGWGEVTVTPVTPTP